jgi:hypothetical protein
MDDAATAELPRGHLLRPGAMLTLNPGTIERFLYSSYDQLAATATVQDFLALLAERFARQRLRALAKLEGKLTTASRGCCSCATTTRADPK